MPAKLHPHKVKNGEWFEKFIYIVGILGPILTIPQALEIFVNKSSQGVSLISWIWYFLASIIFTIYAFKHKLKPLIPTYLAWIIVCLIVVIEILIYR